MAGAVARIAGTSIHPDAAIGTVRLTVGDLSRSRSFYEAAIGLRAAEREDGSLALGGGGQHPLIELHGDPSARAIDRHAPGLYHLAILVPSRVDLAWTLTRLIHTGWPLGGAADHLVSEALYLSDPDGNGIEIYRDRPREQWPYVGGELEMGTLPLDLDDLLDELAWAEAYARKPTEMPTQMPVETKIGHVHLQVAELVQADAFYHGALGFDVTARGYHGALFLSAGGYHHHIGLNTWHSAGAPPPPPRSVGLRSFEVQLPDAAELDRALTRVRAAGIEVGSTEGRALIRDPSGTGLVLCTV